MKRFLPLTLLAAVWLTIALVPALNVLFRVQFNGSPLAQLSARRAQEYEPNFWEKSAQRFPNDINVLWRAASEYPQSEEPEEEEEEDYSDEEYTSVAPLAPGAPGAPVAPPPPGSPPPVAPTPTPDPSLPKSQIFPGQLKGDPKVETLRRLDLLIARFPNNANLIAARLRKTLEWTSPDRVGGEMSDARLRENQAAGKPSPERSETKPNFTANDMQKAISLAQRGSKLEPDNGFFDWMKCCFLMYAWRDGEAFQALDVASVKKRFDDHALAEQNAELKALSTAFNRNLVMEEKLQVHTESFNHFPRYARFREMARILAWQSVKAQRRGDHQGALRIIAGLGRTAAHMRENSKTYIDAMVASALEGIAWSSATYDARAASGRTRRNTANQQITSFQAYATKYGRSQLAAEMGRNYTAKANMLTKVRAAVSSGNMFYGIPTWVFIVIVLLWMGGVALLSFLPSSFLLMVLFRLLGRTSKARALLHIDESSAEEIPSSRDVRGGALACGGLRALGTVLCGGVVVGLAIASIMIAVGEAESLFSGIKDFWNDTILDSGNNTGMEGFYYLMASTQAPESLKRWIVMLSPLLFGVLFAVWRATEFQKVRNGEQTFSAMAFFKSLLQGHAFRSPSGRREDLDVTTAILKVVDWFLMVLLIAAWCVLATIPKSDTSVSWLIPFTFVVLFSGILLTEKIMIWRARPRRRQAVRYGLRLLSRSLWGWLVLGSTLYFVLLLVSLPLRGRAEQRLDRLMRLGELPASQTNTP